MFLFRTIFYPNYQECFWRSREHLFVFTCFAESIEYKLIFRGTLISELNSNLPLTAVETNPFNRLDLLVSNGKRS